MSAKAYISRFNPKNNFVLFSVVNNNDSQLNELDIRLKKNYDIDEKFYVVYVTVTK